MILKKMRAGTQYLTVLCLFLASFPALLLGEEVAIFDTPSFNPIIHDEEIFLKIEEIKEGLASRLSEIDSDIETIRGEIVNSNDSRAREELMGELTSLEDERLTLVATALLEIGDLRVEDAEKNLMEFISSPPPRYMRPEHLLASEETFDLFGPEVEFGGYLKIRTNVDISIDNEYEDLVEIHPRAFLELKYPINDKLLFFISAHGEFDYLTGGTTRYDYEVALDEAYLDIAFEKFDLRIGNQIITWGRTDAINPTDNINALDLTNAIIGDLDERKLPTFAIKLDYYTGVTIFEAVLIPFFQGNRFDLAGSDWAIFNSGVFSQVGGGFFPYAYLLDDASLMLFESRSLEYYTPDPPTFSPENTQGGVRISSKYRGWDFSLSYLYAFDKIPVVRLSENFTDAIRDNTVLDYLMNISIYDAESFISLDYERYHMVGFDFATTWGKYGFRGEMGIFFDKFTYTTELTARKHNYVHYVIGVDRTFPKDFYVNLQFMQKIIFDYHQEIIEDEIQNSIILYTYKNLMNDELIPEIRMLYNITDGDFFITPKITYKYSGNLEFSLGMNILEGDPLTTFGHYTNNDQVFFEVKYRF